jgi:alpha-tubulin suppressor-like RCC1 family protein
MPVSLASHGDVRTVGIVLRRLLAIGVVAIAANVVATHDATADMGALVDASGAPTQALVPMRYLALGTSHSCVVMADAALRCFGDSSYGQLGLGAIREVGATTSTTGNFRSVAAAPATALGAGVRQVVAGGEHTCALLTTGAVQCWGYGAFGRLGYGDETNRGTADSHMGVNLPAVALGAGRTATAIAAGAAHTCALLDNAVVKCWGDNVEGQLGLGDRDSRGDGPGEMGDALPAVAFATGRSAIAIAAGGNHTCAILDNDALVCWGANDVGQLGQGSTARLGDNESVATIAAVPVGGVRAVALGDAHTCVITTAAAMKCFGSGGNGRLGTDATDNRGDASGEVAALPAIFLGAARSVRAVAAGGSHSCALLDDASVDRKSVV